jgi:hypothetical protein
VEHLDDLAVQVDTSRGEDKGDVGKVEIANIDLVAIDTDIEVEPRYIELEGSIAWGKLGKFVVEEGANVESASVGHKETRTASLKIQLKSASSEADGEVGLGNSDGAVSSSLVLPDLVIGAVASNQGFQVSSTAGLGESLLCKLLNLLLGGAASMSASGDVLGQSSEETAIDTTGVGSLDRQALLLLLLRESDSGSHFEKLEVMERT